MTESVKPSPLEVKVKFLHPNAKFIAPRAGDAGYDLYCIEDVFLPAFNGIGVKVIEVNGQAGITWMPLPMKEGEIGDPQPLVVKIRTGLSLEIPAGYYGQVFDRSSMGVLGVKSFAGVIDCIYRGEVSICLANLSNRDVFLKAGSKVAQLVFLPYGTPTVVVVDTDLSATERGAGGFGSTGAI